MTDTPVTAPCARHRRGAGVLLGVLTVAVLCIATAQPVLAAPVAVTDSFTRTASGGWGAADAGGTWSVNSAARFAVAGGVGTVSLTTDGVTQRATLPGAGVINDVATSLSLSQLPTGTGVYVSIAGRRTAAGQYQAKLRVLPTGAVAVNLSRLSSGWAETALVPEQTVAGVPGVVGQFVRVRVQVTGTSPTTVRAKVWPAAVAEPSAWTASATDNSAGWQVAGGVGLDSYLSRSSVPLTVRFDNVSGSLDAATGTPPPAGPVPPSPEPPPPPPPPPPLPPGDRDTASAGSVAVGAAQYPVPAYALFVSPSGNDAAGGSSAAPWRTLGRAVAAAPAGSTIVLRQGTYHESVTIPSGKRLTVQAYPGEAVWLDGSRAVTNWAADGAAWRSDGWTPQFDRSPTFTRGAPDNTGANWSFVNPAYPLAAWPEQVFIDGAPQRQVASRGAVTAGTFYVDTAADRLYVGTNPGGRAVRASALITGLIIRGAGSVVRGIGVQRYANSVPDKGALQAVAPDVTIENVVVRDSATEGIFAGANGLGVRVTLRHVTVERSGMLGIETSFSDGLVVDGVRAVGNNTERFNQAPVSGGLKITKARGLTIRNSVFADNYGPGLWIDESSYDATVVGNDMLRNAGHGLSYEISSRALIADNVVAGNGGNGMKINNASNMDIWNNTVVDNADRPLWVVQDPRVASNTSTPGHDPRQPLPDPTVTWLLGPVTLKNNVIGGTTSANCLLCGQDTALRRTDEQIAITTNGNAYHRTSTTRPTWTVTWPVGAAAPQVYTTLAAFRQATGQEVNGQEFTGAPVVDAAYRLTPALAAVERAIAQPLPAAVASRMGAPTGEERLGARF